MVLIECGNENCPNKGEPGEPFAWARWKDVTTMPLPAHEAQAIPLTYVLVECAEGTREAQAFCSAECLALAAG